MNILSLSAIVEFYIFGFETLDPQEMTLSSDPSDILSVSRLLMNVLPLSAYTEFFIFAYETVD